jgi:hypothetical protein
MRTPQHVPTLLPTPPDAVAARLVRQGLPMHSVWFPTRADTERWSQSGSPLYVLPPGRTGVTVGPRLGNMWASAFSPVLHLTLAAEDGGTRVTSRRRMDPVTLAILLCWSVVLAGWGAGMVAGAASGWPFWGMLLVATVTGPAVGWIRGGAALDAGIPWLTEVLLAPDDLEDW